MSVVRVGIIGQNTKRTLKLFSSIKKKKAGHLSMGGNRHFHSMLVNMPIKTASLGRSNLRMPIRIQNMYNC